MTNHTASVALALFGLVLVLSGIAGITMGGTSAQAGWWLVVVGSLVALAGFVRQARRST